MIRAQAMTIRSNHGFSLVELMLALAAGLVVSLALVAFLMSSFKSNSEYVQSTRLTQELRNGLDVAARDLRRAGYDENALAKMASGTGSKFARMLLSTEITPATVPKTYSCVIYGYDRPNSGACASASGTVDTCNGEVRGLRRVQRTVNNRPVGVLEYAVSTGGITPSCTGAGPDYTTNPPYLCNAATTWCVLSDPTRLNISRFALTDSRVTVDQVQLRDIGISLQGGIAGSTEYTRGVRTSVRIRSECFDSALSNCSAAPSN